MPGFITFNATSRTFDVYATLPAAIGAYDITVTASIPQPSDTSGVKTVSQTFKLTVVGDCATTNLIDMPINDMTIQVTGTTSQNVAFQNTRAQLYGIPSFCGILKFVWTPSLPSFLTLDSTLSSLTLATNDITDVGTYSI
jgi:hypothetical protein